MKSGFTLIEVMVFTVIITIIIVSLISTSIAMSRQTQVTIHKAYATRYADELAEWLRIQKELSWQTFYARSQNIPTAPSSPRTFCVNGDIALTSTLDTALLNYNTSNLATCSYNGPTSAPIERRIFRRTVTFDTQSSNTQGVKATINVEWLEIGNTVNRVRVQTYFAPR